MKVKLAEKEHPIFKAHFPENPILAGFLQIDIILNILDQQIKAIKYAKFIDPIYPDDIVTYFITDKEGLTLIKIFKDDKKISEIKYETK